MFISLKFHKTEPIGIIHEKLQEQMGMYGMGIPQRGETETDRKVQADIPVMLSEWTNDHLMRRLQMGIADWYAIKICTELLWGYCFRELLYQA